MDKNKLLKEMYSKERIAPAQVDPSLYLHLGQKVAEERLEAEKPLLEQDKYAEKKYIAFLEQKILRLEQDHRILRSNQRTLESRIVKLQNEKTKRNS